MDWVHIAISIVTSGAAGALAALSVIIKLSKWQQKIEDRVTRNEESLIGGKVHVDSVPMLSQAMQQIALELKELKEDERAARATYVTRRECDVRHPRHRQESGA